LALIAVASGRTIGVDLERVRSDLAADEIARRFFSASERAALDSFPSELKSEAFFRCWTRKEAFIKAIGEGLSYPLDAFDVTLGPDEPARVLRVGDDPAEAARWTIHDLKVPSGFAAALAASGPVSEIVYRADFI
jgi:4'-phosphopantetheinyl transferase